MQCWRPSARAWAPAVPMLLLKRSYTVPVRLYMNKNWYMYMGYIFGYDSWSDTIVSRGIWECSILLWHVCRYVAIIWWKMQSGCMPKERSPSPLVTQILDLQILQFCPDDRLTTYHIAGKFGGELNWRFGCLYYNRQIKIRQTFYSHIYVWRSRTETPNLNPPIFLQ